MFFDQVGRPGEARWPKVLQVVIAVHVDQVEATLARDVRIGPALRAEPLVEHEVVLLDAAGFVAARPLAPDDQPPAVVREETLDRAEPPRSSCRLVEAALESQPTFRVSLELRRDLPGRPEPRDPEA